MQDTKQYIGCDAHRDYSVFRMMDERGGQSAPMRVSHRDGEMQRFLKTLPPESPVAIESCGGWMWLVRAMEEAGLEPHLAHAFKVKQRIAGPHQTDESDAGGLAMLLRNGTLPEVWIAPRPFAICVVWCAAASPFAAIRRRSRTVLTAR